MDTILWGPNDKSSRLLIHINPLSGGTWLTEANNSAIVACAQLWPGWVILFHETATVFYKHWIMSSSVFMKLMPFASRIGCHTYEIFHSSTALVFYNPPPHHPPPTPHPTTTHTPRLPVLHAYLWSVPTTHGSSMSSHQYLNSQDDHHIVLSPQWNYHKCQDGTFILERSADVLATPGTMAPLLMCTWGLIRAGHLRSQEESLKV